MNQPTRWVRRVHNDPKHHSHSLENFFSDDAERNPDWFFTSNSICARFLGDCECDDLGLRGELSFQLLDGSVARLDVLRIHAQLLLQHAHLQGGGLFFVKSISITETLERVGTTSKQYVGVHASNRICRHTISSRTPTRVQIRFCTNNLQKELHH